MKPIDYFILVMVGVAFALALKTVINNYKSNKGCIGCGGDCSTCKGKNNHENTSKK